MKRIAIKLVVFLLLGAMVNVTVAWGLAVRPGRYHYWRLGRDPYVVYDRISPEGYLTTILRRGGELILCQANETRGTSPSPEILDNSRYTAMVPAWSVFKGQEPLPVEPDRLVLFVEAAVGWPSLSLRSFATFRVESAEQWDTDHVRSVEIPRLRDSWRIRVPYDPIVTGFAINTLFYGVILWLLWSTPFATRRLIRKRRGRCLKCGYDLRHAEHDVCPECGA